MIRLVVSDMDGCLLDGNGGLPDRFNDAFDLMQEKGVVFTAASGRAIEGMKRPFGDLAEKMSFISDNGARVYSKGEKIFSRILPYERYRPAIEEMRRHEGLLAVACGEKGAWVEDMTVITGEMKEELSKYYPSWKECSFDDIDDRIIKFALLYFDDIEKNIYPYFEGFDDDRVCVQVTAFVWIDIYEKGISKGTGIEAIQKELGISPDETIVFGDYLNDLPMADLAARSFAPANAHPKVRQRYTDVIAPNTEGSVPDTIISLMTE